MREEEEVQPAVVQDYGDTAMQEVGKQSIQGVGRGGGESLSPTHLPRPVP